MLPRGKRREKPKARCCSRDDLGPHLSPSSRHPPVSQLPSAPADSALTTMASRSNAPPRPPQPSGPPSRPLDTARPRAPPPSTSSSVGARLLNKRQSVSYHTTVSSSLAGFPVVPNVPALPLGMTGVGAGKGKGRDALGETGLDVDMLAGEGFRAEDCECV